MLFSSLLLHCLPYGRNVHVCAYTSMCAYARGIHGNMYVYACMYTGMWIYVCAWNWVSDWVCECVNVYISYTYGIFTLRLICLSASYTFTRMQIFGNHRRNETQIINFFSHYSMDFYIFNLSYRKHTVDLTIFRNFLPFICHFFHLPYCWCFLLRLIHIHYTHTHTNIMYEVYEFCEVCAFRYTE